MVECIASLLIAASTEEKSIETGDCVRAATFLGVTSSSPEFCLFLMLFFLENFLSGLGFLVRCLRRCRVELVVEIEEIVCSSVFGMVDDVAGGVFTGEMGIFADSDLKIEVVEAVVVLVLFFVVVVLSILAMVEVEIDRFVVECVVVGGVVVEVVASIVFVGVVDDVVVVVFSVSVALTVVDVVVGVVVLMVVDSVVAGVVVVPFEVVGVSVVEVVFGAFVVVVCSVFFVDEVEVDVVDVVLVVVVDSIVVEVLVSLADSVVGVL